MMGNDEVLDIKYRTGLLWQDCQHEDWISLLARLKKARSGEKDQKLFHQILSFLVMYVSSHFSLEKKYMEQYDYPERRFHLEEHRLFTLKLKDFRQKYTGLEEDGIIRLIDSISEWVYSHIQENDKKLGAFILKKEQPDLKKQPG